MDRLRTASFSKLTQQVHVQNDDQFVLFEAGAECAKTSGRRGAGRVVRGRQETLQRRSYLLPNRVTHLGASPGDAVSQGL